MRLWHIDLLPYLPDLQFRGQLRELVAIMHDWRDKGKTNHILINRVTDYGKLDLYDYFTRYAECYEIRYGTKLPLRYHHEFFDFVFDGAEIEPRQTKVFDGWHDKEYLRICMANLYEKHHFGKGKSRIIDEEWERLAHGYFLITGEEYRL